MHITNPADYCTVYKCMNIADPANIEMPVHKVNMVGNFKIDEHVISADLINCEIEIENKPVKSIAIRNLRKKYKRIRRRFSQYSRSENSNKNAIKVLRPSSCPPPPPQPGFEPPPTRIV